MRLAHLPAAVWALFLACALPAHAYNWSWDQGHDCTFYDNRYGRFDYEGNFVPDECCPCTKCNVYSRSGVYYESATDLTLPGRGPSLSVSRTWNSSDLSSGLLGRGWTFNLGRNLLPVRGKDGLEYLIVRRNNGQEIKMRRQGGGYAFTTAMQFDFSVEATPNGWRLSEKDGAVNEYNRDGKPLSITDRDGLSLTFEYADATGCLTRARNASGRSLEFTLNPNGKVESVADDAGRSVNYAYDGAGNLVRATYWDGSVASYAYDGQNLLVGVSNRRGQMFREIAYDALGKVIELKEKGETAHFQYDTAAGTVTKTDSQGRKWVVKTDANGINIEETDPLGHTIRRQPSNVAGPRNFDWIEDQNGNRTTFTYNTAGDMLSRTDPLGNRESWTYDSRHLAVSHTDAMGVVTRFEYDARGNMTRKVEAAGTGDERTWGYTYDAVGSMLSERNPLGAVTTHEYDSLGNKTKQVGPMGETISWTYDSARQKTSMTDPMGNTWTYGYDGQGHPIRETDPLGHAQGWEYDLDGNLIAEIDKLGHRTGYMYDAWNRQTRKIGPIQDTTVQQWTTIGDDSYLSGVRDAMGNWTYRQYDSGGRKTAEIAKRGDASSTPDSNDQVTRFTFDAAGNIIRIANPEGDTNGYAYDRNNRRIRQCNGVGECAETVYDAKGRMIRNALPNGNTISNEYNAHGQVIRISDGLGTLLIKDYDRVGNIASERMPGRGRVTYAYDSSGRVVKRTDSAGNSTTYRYDAAGRLINSTDAKEGISHFTHDSMGRTIAVENALGDSVASRYDAVGNRVAIFQEGFVTTFSYSPLGLIVSTVNPDGDMDSNGYDKLGRMIRKRDPSGLVTRLEYDESGRLVGRRYSDSTPQESFTYDRNGRISSARNQDVQIEWEYDGHGRIIRNRQVVLDSAYEVAYSYSTADRLSTIRYPGGESLAERRDLRGRLVSISMDGRQIARFGYSGMNLAEKIFANGVSGSMSYDANGRLARLEYTGGNTSLGFSYGYDKVGNITLAEKHHDPTRSELFEYDVISQLIHARRGRLEPGNTIPSPDHTLDWLIDGRGNWERLTRDGAMEARAHDRNNALITVNGTQLDYDANGNLVNGPGRSYKWNAKNLPVEAGGASVFYDALGRRAAIRSATGGVTRFVHDKERVISESREGLPTRSFVWGGFIDEAIAAISGTTMRYFLTNHQHSVVAIVDSSAQVLEQYEYGPNGETTIRNPVGQEITETAIGNFIGFMGRTREPGSRFEYYFRSRIYDSELGRFISADPIQYRSGDPNFYRFVGNNPLNRMDPSGLVSSTSSCDISPWELGVEWLTGYDRPTHRDFGAGCEMTEDLRRHQFIIDYTQQLVAAAESNCKGCDNSTIARSGSYSLSGIQGVPKYLKDYSTLLTGGLTGNLTVTFLGSYSVKAIVSDIHCKDGTASANFTVKNSSSFSSATRPPVLGYTDFWLENVGPVINGLFEEGPGSTITQTFNWDENLNFSGNPCCK